MRITISGPIGSGKSTVGYIIAERLGLSFFSGGYFFREQASSLGMDVVQYNRYAESHREIDIDLDSMIVDFLRGHDDVVVESRLAGWLCYRDNLPAFKVFLSANQQVRIDRIRKREGDGSEVAKKAIEREASEVKRYLEYNNIDYSDTSIYDVVINSDDLTAQEVAERIYGRVNNQGKVKES